MSKTTDNLTIKNQWVAIQRKNKITQVEKGCHELFNQYQEEMLKKVTTASKINADHKGHKGLQKSDVDAGIKITKEIPNGIY